MKPLTVEKRAAVLRCLAEGNSIRSTSRITGTAKDTILKLVVEAGEACADFHDHMMVKLPCKELQLDEMWSFVGCKEKRKEVTKREHPGDVWVWTAIDPESKLIPSWRIGDRTATTGFEFCRNLSGRFANKLQITSDGNPTYQLAVGSNFPEADFAQVVKVYGVTKNGFNIVEEIRKDVFQGDPDKNKISTCCIERSNLMVRTTSRRFTRLTNGFSKKLENHGHGVALGMMSYNFCRKHSGIKTSPAVAAGLTDHIWTYEEVVAMVDAYVVRRTEMAFEQAFESRRKKQQDWGDELP